MKQNQIFQLVLTSTFVAIILLMSLIPQLGFVTFLPGVAVTLVHIPTMIGIFILKPRYGFILGVVFGIGSLMASYMYAATAFDLAFQNPLVSVLPRALFGLAAWTVYQGFLALSKLSYGKYILFGLVSLITIVAVYFGSLEITKNAIWNEYNTAVLDETVSEETLVELYENASTTEHNVLKIVIPISLVIIALFITGYYYLVSNQNYKDLAVSSSFIVGTLIHTVLVLASVILFADAFKMAFGDAVTLIYGIAASNGLIEALTAVAIGTPIYITLNRLPMVQERLR